MKPFDHMDASSVKEASKALKGGNAVAIAGGTDLLGSLKDEILPTYPKTVVNLKTIPGLDYIKEEGGFLKIGALTKIAEIAESDLIKKKYSALAEAAFKVSSPTIRKMGTIGGNVCQMHRCWYFRNPGNRFECFRKGGSYCPAMLGDSRYHAIFGPQKGCIAASPHDTAPALMAFGATIVTSKREVPAEEFWAVNGSRSNVLEDGEIVTEIKIPAESTKSAFSKLALRKTIDFPIVNCAVVKTAKETRIVLGGVSPFPVRVLKDSAPSSIDEKSAVAAGEAAVKGAKPLPKNKYKVEIAKTLVKRTLQAVAD